MMQTWNNKEKTLTAYQSRKNRTNKKGNHALDSFFFVITGHAVKTISRRKILALLLYIYTYIEGRREQHNEIKKKVETKK